MTPKLQLQLEKGCFKLPKFFFLLNNGRGKERPYSLLPTPYSLLPTPYSLLPTPYSLLPTPYSLLPTPYSLIMIIEKK
jgi:hypothetical protein